MENLDLKKLALLGVSSLIFAAAVPLSSQETDAMGTQKMDSMGNEMKSHDGKMDACPSGHGGKTYNHSDKDSDDSSEDDDDSDNQSW